MAKKYNKNRRAGEVNFLEGILLHKKYMIQKLNLQRGKIYNQIVAKSVRGGKRTRSMSEPTHPHTACSAATHGFRFRKHVSERVQLGFRHVHQRSHPMGVWTEWASTNAIPTPSPAPA